MEPNDADSEKERSTIQPSGSHVAPYHQQLDETKQEFTCWIRPPIRIWASIINAEHVNNFLHLRDFERQSPEYKTRHSIKDV